MTGEPIGELTCGRAMILVTQHIFNSPSDRGRESTKTPLSKPHLVDQPSDRRLSIASRQPFEVDGAQTISEVVRLLRHFNRPLRPPQCPTGYTRDSRRLFSDRGKTLSAVLRFSQTHGECRVRFR